MRIVVHVGMSKTGTTSLQKTLTRASNCLKAQGILYPEIPSTPCHTQLLFAIASDDELSGRYGRKDIEGLRKSINDSEDAWKMLDAQIREEPYHTVVLSSEFILGLRPSAVKKFFARLLAYSSSIRAVAYYRNPVSHYASNVQQTVKFGHKIRTPYTDLGYRAGIRKMRSVNRVDFFFSLFDRSVLREGCVCNDFMSRHIGMSDGLIRSVAVVNDNESISAEAMAFLQEVNRFIFPKRRRPGNSLSKSLIARVMKEEEADSYTPPKVSAAVRSIIETVHAQDIEWLRANTPVDFDAEPPEEDVVSTMKEDRGQFDRETLRVADLMFVDSNKLERLQSRVLADILRDAVAQASSTSAGPNVDPLPAQAKRVAAMLLRDEYLGDKSETGPLRMLLEWEVLRHIRRKGGVDVPRIRSHIIRDLLRRLAKRGIHAVQHA